MIFLRLKLFHPLFVIMNADFRMNVRIFKRQIIKLCTLFIYVSTLFIFFLGTKLQKQIPTATSAAIYKKSYKKLIISYKLCKTLTYYAHQQ